MDAKLQALLPSLTRAPQYEAYTVERRSFSLSDGTLMQADVALPVGADLPLPTILCRSPYGKGGSPLFFEFAHFGYACVLQHCRGRYGSEGEWEPFVNEQADGREALAWLEKEDFCNGSIVMTGFSYMAMCQWLLAENAPACLKGLDIEAYNPVRNNQLFTNGMFRLEAYTGWTVYNTGLSDLPDTTHALYPKALTYMPQNEMDEAVFGAQLPWYRQWLRHPNLADDYWHEGVWKVLEEMPPKTHLPLCMRVGWYDTHLQGMLDAWQNLPEETRKKSVFFLPPCHHRALVAGQTDPTHAYDHVGPAYFRSKLCWFDHLLKDLPLPPEFVLGGGSAFVYGEDRWQTLESLPPKTRELALYPAGDRLSPTPAAQEVRTYVYDPADPVPAHGSDDIMIDYIYQPQKPTENGRQCLPPAGQRQDVLTFFSAPAAEDLPLWGRIRVKLFVSSTAEDTAFTLKVSEVLPDGTALHLREGITSLRYPFGSYREYIPNTLTEAEFLTPAVAFTLKKGRRLRVDITSSAFPSFHIHPNTAKLWSEEACPVKAKQTLYFGGSTPSALYLPIKEDNP